MFKFSLKFKNNILEKNYSDFKWKFNLKPCIYLLFFNFYVEVCVTFFAILQQMYQVLFLNVALFGTCATLLYLSRKASSHKFLQTFFIVFSITVPYITEMNFTIFEMRQRKAGYCEWLVCGAIYQIFFSFFSKLKLSWAWALASKFFGGLYVFYFNLDEKFDANKNIIMLGVLYFLGLVGDYNQDKNDRESFMNEFITHKKNEFYKHLVEMIPDQVFIMNSKDLVFANKSTLELFKEKDLKRLQQLLMENLEIVDFDILLEIEGRVSKDIKNPIFLRKIDETLKETIYEMETSKNLPLYTAIIKNLNNEHIENEFDLKMKKIFWENDDAVLVLMSKVDEKNLNSRLEYVNSFLNYVLGNVSHDISTPFNILLGLLDTSIKKVKEIELLQDLKIARNMGEILINMFHTMIDLFNIRKGLLLLNLEQVNLNQEFREILFLFEEILKNRKVKVSIDENLTVIWTDRRRFRQIIIGVLNYYLKHIEKSALNINLSKSSNDLYEIVIESYFSKNESGIIAPSSLRDVMMNKLKSSSSIHKKSINAGVSDSFAEGNLIDSGMNFSMLDYLVLCLSHGEMDHLEIDHGNHSNYVCRFRIKDICKSSVIQLKDLLIEQKKFNVNYLKRDDFLGGEDSQSYEGSASFDDNKILISTFENTHLNEQKSYCQNFKMMPSMDPLCVEIEQNQNESSSPFIRKKIHLFPSIFSSKTCRQRNNESISFTKKYYILNVDDNFLNLMVISKYCRDFAFEVVEAKNGLEAIKEVENLLDKKTIAFDLIFMDCDMPILDGFEASRRINKIYLEKKKFQPGIVAITANVINEEISFKWKRSGMRELVLKPMSIDKFKELLKKYLNF